MTKKSHANAKVEPIPAADPCTAAMKIFLPFTIFSKMGLYSFSNCIGISSPDVSTKSAPAQKPGPAPLITTALIEESSSACSKTSRKLYLNSSFNELYWYKNIFMKNSIRISGGFLKGKKVPFDFKSSLRPTSNKLKEILFNWLQFEMKSSICLDLFAGTGSIGIEAVSRGSAKTIFVELNKRNYSQLSKTLISLDLKEQTKVYFKDAKTWIKNNDLSDFDLIFLDPPFGENYELKILNLLIQDKNLKSSCKIYLEFSKFTDLVIPNSVTILKEKSVGDVKALLLCINEN